EATVLQPGARLEDAQPLGLVAEERVAAHVRALHLERDRGRGLREGEASRERRRRGAGGEREQSDGSAGHGAVLSESGCARGGWIQTHCVELGLEAHLERGRRQEAEVA